MLPTYFNYALDGYMSVIVFEKCLRVKLYTYSSKIQHWSILSIIRKNVTPDIALFGCLAIIGQSLFGGVV